MISKKLKNKITWDKANELLRKGNFMRKKNADRVELIYIDFYLFEVIVDPKLSEPKSDWAMADCLTGCFTFFERNPEIEMETSHRDETLAIGPDEAKEIVKREYTFHLLHRNLRTKLSAKVSQIKFESAISYPFWIGYYIHSNHYRMEVLDGVNGKKQAGKIKSAVTEQLIREMSNRTNMPKPSLQDTFHSSGR